MNPNTNSIPPTPVEPASTMPQAQPTQQAPTSVNSTAPASGVTPSSSSNRGVLVAVIAVVSLLVLAILGWFLYNTMFSPAAKANTASTGFMKAITTKNVTTALTYFDNPGDSEKTFLISAADNVAGTFKIDQKKMDSGKGYFLYNLSGANKKYARTTLEKSGSRWVVSSFVFSNSALKLIPSSTAETPTITTPKQTTPAPQTVATTAGTCLTQDDYKWMNYDKKPSSVTFDSTYNPAKYTNNKTADMFFEPDSLKETSFTTIYDDWADFAKHTTNKQWKFRLEGSVFGSDSAAASSKKLANDRAEKVKAELVKRGVSADRVIIDTPHDYSKENQSAADKIYRRVQVVIDPTCTAKQ